MVHLEPRRSLTMFKRTALLALVASAVVGLAAIVATGAEARGHGGGHGGGGMGGGGGRGAGGGHHHMIRHHGGHGHHHHHHHRPHHGHHHHHHHRHHRHVHHHCWHRHGHHHHHCHWHWRRYWVGGTYVTPTYPVSYPAAVARPAGSCTCLVKEYLPNGAVLFRDVCTNESAMNPPAQAAEVPPQGS